MKVKLGAQIPFALSLSKGCPFSGAEREKRCFDKLSTNGLLRDLFYRYFFVTSRSEEHTSELQSLMRISYAVFCLKKKQKQTNTQVINTYISINHTLPTIYNI